LIGPYNKGGNQGRIKDIAGPGAVGKVRAPDKLLKQTHSDV